ncbi:ADP-ribosylglycohydrolase family protein [Lentzea aerocolonigenes]|uniref:ADP-ribosylglycohydrolase family protein n=1 Tax=Lentzea aerocolonigenes TaxID=68170 RepID=UPI000A530BBE|nr:ADP-ribosylglycohydrolase family protein [Lentzea aerocolonigenes]
MNRDEAISRAGRWVAEHRGGEFRVDENSVFQTRDGWTVGYAVPSEDGRVRGGGKWPKTGVEVHVLGTFTEIDDGNVVDRPWEAVFDPEFVWMSGMRTDPYFTAVAGWRSKANGDFHPNPAHVPGPVASGEPWPTTPMERLLGYLQRGWYDRAGLAHNGVHGEVLIAGDASLDRFDYPETLEVHTTSELLPEGTTRWYRVALTTILSRIYGSKFQGTRPVKLHINPGLRYDTVLPLSAFSDEASQHMRMCGCYEHDRWGSEVGPWIAPADLAVLGRIMRAAPVDAVPAVATKFSFTLAQDAHGRFFLIKDDTVDTGRLRGCLIGGAIGDALGANTENLPMEVVYERHGPDGITDLPEDPAVTDDMQMTLFTFEAVIRAHVRRRITGNAGFTEVVQHAYQRWLHTQKTPWEKARGPLSTLDEPDGWLIGHGDLFRMRAPGLTVTSALQQYGRTGVMATSENPANDSKGCGGAMRVAPIACYAEDALEAFSLAKCAAELTHGHPSGYLSAGFFAVLVHEALQGNGLLEGVDSAMKEIVRYEHHEEVVAAVEHAIELAALGEPSVARVEELGRGGVGETALAIALYSALVTDDPNEALLISVNHGGDNDSTASMCGNLVGALHGVDKIRPDWVERVQFREVVDEMVADWAKETGSNPPMAQEWFTRYPPS